MEAQNYVISLGIILTITRDLRIFLIFVKFYRQNIREIMEWNPLLLVRTTI